MNQNANDLHDPMDFMGERLSNSFVFYETNCDEVSKIIGNFKNKKTTINNIPIFIVRKISPHIPNAIVGKTIQ